MTIRDLVLQYLLTQSTLTALVGTRVRPDMLPQKTTYPATVITTIDVVRPQTLGSVAGLAMARMQLDTYADTRAVADIVASVLRNLLDGFGWKSGPQYLEDASTSPATQVRAWIRLESEREGVEPDIANGLARRSDDYMVQFQTHSGAY